MNKPKNEVAVISDNKPAFLKDQEADCDIEIDVNEIKVSEIALGQAISKAVADGHVKNGEFYDKITNENYGKSVEIIVLKHKRNWLKFDQNKLVDRSSNGDTWSNGEALGSDEKWLNLYQTFYVLVRGEAILYPKYVSFSKTSAKEGVELLNLIYRLSKAENEPVYSRSYIVSSEPKEMPKGKTFVKVVSKGEYLTEKEFEHAKAVYKGMAGVDLEQPLNVEEKEFGEEDDRAFLNSVKLD